MQSTIELALSSVSQLTGPTPRSKLDPIVYDTTDYRDASIACLSDSKIYKFSSPRSEPPQFAAGITFLNINKISGIRLLAKVSDITRESYKVSLNSYHSTMKLGAGCTFFEVSQTDPDFQQGKVITYLPQEYSNDVKITTWLFFARAFAEEVEIVTWLNQIDSQCFETGLLDIDTSIQHVDLEGFSLVYGSCRQPQKVCILGSTWVAYQKCKPGIDSGRIDKLKLGLVGAVNEAQGTVTKDVVFKKRFKKPPQVWLALCGINMMLNGDDLRFKTRVVEGSITTTGFNYHIISWGKAVLETVSLSWLAVELD